MSGMPRLGLGGYIGLAGCMVGLWDGLLGGLISAGVDGLGGKDVYILGGDSLGFVLLYTG